MNGEALRQRGFSVKRGANVTIACSLPRWRATGDGVRIPVAYGSGPIVQFPALPGTARVLPNVLISEAQRERMALPPAAVFRPGSDGTNIEETPDGAGSKS